MPRLKRLGVWSSIPILRDTHGSLLRSTSQLSAVPASQTPALTFDQAVWPWLQGPYYVPSERTSLSSNDTSKPHGSSRTCLLPEPPTVVQGAVVRMHIAVVCDRGDVIVEQRRYQSIF